MIQYNRPLRVLERAMGGPLGPGDLGVVMSRHGTGKVAVLTSIALDHAMDELPTLHVAVGKSVGDVRAYHDSVFAATVESLGLKEPVDPLNVERHKQIYTFKAGLDTSRLGDALDLLAENAQFRPQLIELQNWPDFEKGCAEEVRAIKDLAERHGCAIWMTAQTHRGDDLDDRGVPKAVAEVDELLSVLIALEAEGDRMNLRFVKTQQETTPAGVRLEFDPQSMLVRWR